MAIIKGINVTVQVNEQDLKEYDDLDEEHDAEQPGLEDSMLYMNSKYIEATSGAHFSINTIVLNSTKGLAQGLNLEYIVDGVSVGHEFMILKQSELEDGIWSCCSEGPSRVTKAGEEVIRPYMFSEISISADTFATCQRKQVKWPIEALGTVVFKIWRRTRFRQHKKRAYARGFGGRKAEIGELNEKMLKGKALTHSVCLGDEVVSHNLPEIWSSQYVDGKDSPFAIFTFRYCSKKALQSLLLVPRTSSPERTPPPVPLEERPVEELTLEELRELAKRQKARFQAECATKVKPERDIKVEKGLRSEIGIERGCDNEVKPKPGSKVNNGSVSENNGKGGYDAKVDELLASIRSELDERRAHDTRVGELLASVKSGFGAKRNRDEEMEDLLASATSKKVKGPIANGEVIDLSD